MVKPPGNMPGSRHYRLLGFTPRLPEVHTFSTIALRIMDRPPTMGVKSAAILDEPSTPEICDRPIRGRLTRPDSKMAGEDPAIYDIPRIVVRKVFKRIRIA